MFYLISIVAFYTLLGVGPLPVGLIAALGITAIVCNCAIVLTELITGNQPKPFFYFEVGPKTEKSPANAPE